MQDDWAKWVLGAEFSANNAPSAITLASPFLANSGQNPHLGFEPSEPLPTDITAQFWVKLINVENFTKRMKELTEHLCDEMLIAQAIYEANANASRHPCPQYFVGDEVWLNAKNLNTAQPAVKLDDCHVSHFWVKHVFKRNPLIVKLELPESMKVHPVFYVTLLSHVATDPLPGQCQEPREPVIAENGERAWYVNRVLNFKLDRQYSPPLLKYYINWEGYLSTWEPFNLVDNCQEALDEFHASNPAAAGSHVTPCMIPCCQCTDPWLLFKTLSALVLPKFSFSPLSSFFDSSFTMTVNWIQVLVSHSSPSVFRFLISILIIFFAVALVLQFLSMTASQELSLVKRGYCHGARPDRPQQAITCGARQSHAVLLTWRAT